MFRRMNDGQPTGRQSRVQGAHYSLLTRFYFKKFSMGDDLVMTHLNTPASALRNHVWSLADMAASSQAYARGGFWRSTGTKPSICAEFRAGNCTKCPQFPKTSSVRRRNAGDLNGLGDFAHARGVRSHWVRATGRRTFLCAADFPGRLRRAGQARSHGWCTKRAASCTRKP